MHDGGALLRVEAVQQGVSFGLRHHVRVYGAARTFSARPPSRGVPDPPARAPDAPAGAASASGRYPL
ncbi:hypothetical protein GCM10010177_59510 [Actinomadura citrea]|nr:hypothetical protein GCM10010177_59510 [Actinomadura citrea]